MNIKVIQNALSQIEDNFDDADIVGNAVQVIRCELRSEKPEPLDPEKFFAMKFEAGKNYMVFVEAGAIDAAALVNAAPADYELMFVFVHGDDRPVAEKFLVCDQDSKVFADSRYVDAVDGVTVVDTGGEILAEVLGEKK